MTPAAIAIGTPASTTPRSSVEATSTRRAPNRSVGQPPRYAPTMCSAVPEAANHAALPIDPDRSAISSGCARCTALLAIWVTRTPLSNPPSRTGGSLTR